MFGDVGGRSSGENMVNEILGIFPEEMEVCYTQISRHAHIGRGAIHYPVWGMRDPAPNVLWNILEERYGTGKKGGVYIGFEDDGTPKKDGSPVWQETSVGSLNPQISLAERVIFVGGMMLDSYTIQAQRKEKVPASEHDLIENAVQGILTRDGKFLLALRGGQDQSGKLNVLPGGSVSFIPHANSYGGGNDPFSYAFLEECIDEAGTTFSQQQLCGIFNQRGVHTNRQWAYRATPSFTLEKIAARHAEAHALYQAEKKKTGREDLARHALRDAAHSAARAQASQGTGPAYFPVDAWESTAFLPFSYDGETFLRLLSSPTLEHEGMKLELIGSLPATLYVVGAVDFGKDFVREANQLDEVRKNIAFHASCQRSGGSRDVVDGR